MNIGLQVSVGAPVFSSFGYIPRKRIAEAHGNSIFSFGKLLTDFLQQLNHFTSSPAMCEGAFKDF